MRYIVTILFFALCLTAPQNVSAAEKIWDVTGQKYISEKTLMHSLKQSQNILLGIRTDNGQHYKLAARLIGKLAEAGRDPVIILGNVARNKQNAFAIFAQRHQKSKQVYDATGLDMLLNWAKSGQPEWTIVRPLFDMAMLKRLPLKASGFSRFEIGQIHHDGLGGLPQDIKRQLLPLMSQSISQKAESQIRQDYCGNLPPKVLERLALIHRAQNGLFALDMTEANHETAVLIAPQKYIVKDTGVPRILQKIGDTDKNITLSFVESGQNIKDRQVDYIWYSAAITRPDPCSFLKP